MTGLCICYPGEIPQKPCESPLPVCWPCSLEQASCAPWIWWPLAREPGLVLVVGSQGGFLAPLLHSAAQAFSNLEGGVSVSVLFFLYPSQRFLDCSVHVQLTDLYSHSTETCTAARWSRKAMWCQSGSHCESFSQSPFIYFSFSILSASPPTLIFPSPPALPEPFSSHVPFPLSLWKTGGC